MPTRLHRCRTLTSFALAFGLLWFLPTDASRADQGQAHDRLLKGQERLSAHDAYSKHCAACHGTKGDGAGNRAAPDFTTPAAVVNYDRDRMILAGLLGHEAQVRAIREALKQAYHNKSKAARLLGISRRTLYRRLEEYRIEG